MTLDPGLIVGIVDTATPDDDIWLPCTGAVIPTPARPFIPDICTRNSSGDLSIKFYMTIVEDDCTLPPGAVIGNINSSISGGVWAACDNASGRPDLPDLLSPTSVSTTIIYFYTNSSSVTSFPSGTVLGWAGSPSSAPSGWTWCDGGSDPDLPGLKTGGTFNPDVRMIVSS